MVIYGSVTRALNRVPYWRDNVARIRGRRDRVRTFDFLRLTSHCRGRVNKHFLTKPIH